VGYPMSTSMHYFTVRILIFLFLYLHCKKYRMKPTSKWEVSLHEDLKKISYIQKRGLNLLKNWTVLGLTCLHEPNLFHQCLINFYQTHTCSFLLLAFTIALGTSVTVHVIAQNITDTTHVKPQSAKRFKLGRYTV